jgi:hypothetical protein
MFVSAVGSDEAAGASRYRDSCAHTRARTHTVVTHPRPAPPTHASTHAHAHTQAHTHTYTHARTHTHTCTHMHTHARTHAHTHMHTHTHTHTGTHAHAHVHTHAHTHSHPRIRAANPFDLIKRYMEVTMATPDGAVEQCALLSACRTTHRWTHRHKFHLPYSAPLDGRRKPSSPAHLPSWKPLYSGRFGYFAHMAACRV